ncbi:MAG: hypothetical protein IJ097_03450 [Bacilli bacterium]|nr:hypothetical protein [Bacilli bacterium]
MEKVCLSELNKEVQEKILGAGYDLGEYDNSNNCVILPFGGLESLRCFVGGMQDKKTIYVCNSKNYYKGIIDQIKDMADNGVINISFGEDIIVEDSIDNIIARMEEKKNANNGENSKLL